jgi:hypothetical protein
MKKRISIEFIPYIGLGIGIMHDCCFIALPFLSIIIAYKKDDY